MNDTAILPEHFINRELSWLEFNKRVLEEAEDASNPLLERVKFLSIFSSNLDEFFMVRVAGLREQAFAAGAPQDRNPDALGALEQLRHICRRTQDLVAAQYRCWNDSVNPALDQAGIHIVPFDEVAHDREVERFFRDMAFPIVTPMAIDPSHPRLKYHNRGLYLAAMLRRVRGRGPKELFAVVQIPQVLPRLVPLKHDSRKRFVLLGELMASRLPQLFGGFEVVTSAPFRVTRDSDIDLLEQESDDMLRLIEERLKARQRSDAVRLEISANADERLVQRIMQQEQLRDYSDPDAHDYTEVYRIPGPLDLTGLMSLLKLPGFDELKDEKFTPQPARGFARQGGELLGTVAKHDVLVHHPFESFQPVVDFVANAAADPKVLAIKQTLYRTSGDSPIVRSLIEAAENGKHVTALVELKARFDEAANVSWARQMERSGVHVVFGFLDMKTHCKISLVVRQEEGRVRRYVHLGTGNYNPSTARLYTDIGLFTADEDIAEDASAVFNLLTGYSQGHQWRKLVVAPDDLQRRFVELIDEQTDRARRGERAWVFAKLNAVSDESVIRALYRASQAGVPVDLVCRGICCLRPGIPGISENIRVLSIVDRFLEHSRIQVFGVGEDAKAYISSADWMPRNFYRRVEVMVPIDAPHVRQSILDEIIPVYMKDNVRARALLPDGSYQRCEPINGEPPVRSQEYLLKFYQGKIGPLDREIVSQVAEPAPEEVVADAE